MRGFFISLEGPEGSGKSTQAEMLSNYLKEKGLEVVSTREPGGTKVGEQIRQVLLSVHNREMGFMPELLLYLASRAELVEKVVKPSLAQGKVVIAARFTDSSLAYQGYGRGLDIDLIRKLNEVVTGGLQPDLTILLDIDISQGLMRARGAGEGDRLEREEMEFHRRVRRGYLELAQQEPDRIKVVKADGSMAEVQERVRQCVDEHLKGRI